MAWRVWFVRVTAPGQAAAGARVVRGSAEVMLERRERASLPGTPDRTPHPPGRHRMTDWVAIINPAAGHGDCGKSAPEYLQRLRERGLRVEECFTTGPGDAAGDRPPGRGRQAAGTSSAVGGDGTANEAVNGIVSSGLVLRGYPRDAAPRHRQLLPGRLRAPGARLRRAEDRGGLGRPVRPVTVP